MTTRRLGFITSFLLLGFILLSLVFSSAVAHANDTFFIERVSVASDSTQSKSHSFDSSISADGRFVAFSSKAENLVEGDTNQAPDIFVYDRQTGTIERVSVNSEGIQGNGDSAWPSISDDGRFVAFQSLSTNLTESEETNNAYDVFVYDRLLKSSEIVSRTRDTYHRQHELVDFTTPQISGDGQSVVFTMDTTNYSLATGWHWRNEVHLFNRPTSTLFPLFNWGGTDSDRPSISSNGKYVAYTEYMDMSVYTVDDNMLEKKRLWPLRTDISNDGRFVAFSSYASDLVPDDTNGAFDIFVYDRQTGTIERVSVTSDGQESHSPTQGISNGHMVAISDDGRFVAFSSYASDLVPDDTNGVTDVFVHDRKTGITERVVGNGIQPNSYSYLSSMSGDGRFVAFYSYASNLVANDTNYTSDVFVARNPLYDAGGDPTTNTPPVITLLGDNPLTVTQGSVFVDPGATAWNEEDGDLTDSIGLSGDIDLSTPGEYLIGYTVVDSDGAVSDTVFRTVRVVEKDSFPPVCSIVFKNNGQEIATALPNEFIDIDLSGSSDYDGQIREIRFLVEDEVNGEPDDYWMNYYDWDTSFYSGGSNWDARTKSTRWSFPSVGIYEVLIELEDDDGNTTRCHEPITVENPEENLDDSLTYDYSCPATNWDTDNLVIITHGWQDEGSSDVWQEMAASIDSQIGAEWSVCVYDWGLDSGTFLGDDDETSLWDPMDFPLSNALLALGNAGTHGSFLGRRLAGMDYKHIHFIAHSAGSGLIQNAIKTLKLRQKSKAPTTHATFLDAFAPGSYKYDYGQMADYAEHYVNTDLVPFTDTQLPGAYNFFVTGTNLLPLLAGDGHSYPPKWYATSITPYYSTLPPKEYYVRYGFNLALEGGRDDLPTEYYRNGKCVLDLASPEESCLVRTDIKTLWVVQDGTVKDLLAIEDGGGVAPSPTGVVEVEPENTLRLEMRSPVWADVQVEVEGGQNLLSFDYDFLSPVEAEGILLVLIDKELVLKIDETLTEEGWNTVTQQPIPSLATGEHTIRFYLNSDADVKSSVRIGNLMFSTGETQEVVDNRPPRTYHEVLGTQVAPERYRDTVTVRLHARDDDGGFGLDRTEYSFDEDEETWEEYGEELTFTKEGPVTLYYRSVDVAGNTEEIKSVTFEIVSAAGLLDQVKVWAEEYDDKKMRRVQEMLKNALREQFWIDRNTLNEAGTASVLAHIDNTIKFLSEPQHEEWRSRLELTKAILPGRTEGKEEETPVEEENQETHPEESPVITDSEGAIVPAEETSNEEELVSVAI